MPETNLVLGPPEVLWLDSDEFEHWTGRSPRTVLREMYPAGLAIYARGARKFVLHSEYLAFLKATSKRKEFTTDETQEALAERFTRNERGQLAAVAGGRR